MPYGGFNKVCSNNIGRLGFVWGLFSPGNGVFSSFLGGVLGSRGPVLGPPAFLILGGQRPARSQLPGHGFDQNRYIRGLGDVFCPRARRKLRGDRGSGRAWGPEWAKNQGFSTLALSAGGWKESATETDCPYVTARRTIVYRFRTFARFKMTYRALLRVLPDFSFDKIIVPAQSELGLPAAPRGSLRQLPPASPDASRSPGVRIHRWFPSRLPGLLARAPLWRPRENRCFFRHFFVILEVPWPWKCASALADDARPVVGPTAVASAGTLRLDRFARILRAQRT